MTVALLLLALAGGAGASEVQEVYRDAFADFLRGEYAGAAKHYEYLVSLGSLKALPAASLALTHRDAGEPDIAAAHWLKVSLLEDGEPFYWNQRGWTYLSLGRLREARDSFRKALAVATASFHGAEASFGLGLAESVDGNAGAAEEALKAALASNNPYLHPAANAELGRLNARLRRWPAAIPYLRAALDQDPEQPEVSRLLGKVFEKTGEGRAAWQAYKWTLDRVPGDEASADRLRKLEHYLPGRPVDSMPFTRLARPLLRDADAAEAAADGGSPVRVALFSGPDGRMRQLRRFFVMGSTATRLFDVPLGETVDTVSTYSQWEILFRPDNRVVEVRDATGKVVYVTKQPFRLEPVASGYTVLLKNPELDDIRGMDLSDRELRGFVEVIPTPMGFHAVNELPLDQYLFSVISQAVPRVEIPVKEAYKAIAVLLRTNALARMRASSPNPERTQLCDSAFCTPYFGLARERLVATKAVRESRGVTLTVSERRLLEHHPSCGWATADGIQDRPAPRLAFRHPVDLELLTHEHPDPGEHSEAVAHQRPLWTRWTRVLDAEELRENMDRIEPIGPLRRALVGRRDATGRVQTLLVEGGRGKSELKTPEAIEAFLSPGSLRSTLFTLQPLYDGRRLRGLVVWGAGTGHGRGLCVLGAMGMAHLGRSFADILRHYFPETRLAGWTPPPPKVLAGPRREPARARPSDAYQRRPPRKRLRTR